MTIKQIEPLLQGNFRNEIWVFTPKGENNVVAHICLDPQDTYLPSIGRNRLKLAHLKNLPHKVVAITPFVDIFKGDAKLVICVHLGKGVGWNV